MDMMEIRRAIIADKPQLRYAQGNPIRIFADRAAKMPMAIIIYDFDQAGSGTPSPSNVRPITGGVNDVELRVSSAQGAQDETVYGYHLQNTIYGGYFGFAGYGACEKRMITLDGNAGWAAVGSKYYVQLRDSNFVTSTATDSGYISNMYQFERIQSGGSANVNVDKRFYLQRVSGNASWCRVWVYDSAYSLTQFKALLNATPLQVTYPISPIYESHDPIHPKTKAGTNYIAANGKNIQIRYWTH